MAHVVTIVTGAKLLKISISAMESRLRRRPDAVVSNGRGRGRRTTFDLDVLNSKRGKKAIRDEAVKAFARDLSKQVPITVRDAVLNVTNGNPSPRDKAIAVAVINALIEGCFVVNRQSET